MIPLRDANPSRTFPFITYLLIGANAVVFFFELSMDKVDLNEFVAAFGVVPVRVLDALAAGHPGPFVIVPFFTSMFLHGGWMHLLGNMLFLYVFGDNVEDRFGHFRYLFFYILSGIVAACTQVYFNPHSEMPMVGASGAIAGVLGAYILMFPTAPITTLIPIFFFFQLVELPAFLFLGIWFILQAISGVLSLGIAADAGGVAWWAHIGGFAIGAVSVPILRKRGYA